MAVGLSRMGHKPIAQFEGGLSRKDAEDVAARVQGSDDAGDYWRWLAEYVLNRKAK